MLSVLLVFQGSAAAMVVDGSRACGSEFLGIGTIHVQVDGACGQPVTASCCCTGVESPSACACDDPVPAPAVPAGAVEAPFQFAVLPPRVGAPIGPPLRAEVGAKTAAASRIARRFANRALHAVNSTWLV